MPDAQDKLKVFKPSHSFYVGIDSDGCVFDTMEIKHKECFIPNIIKHWNLQPVSKYAREAAEFVNLYSKDRGVNRWPALIKVFDLLRERSEVQARKVNIPQAQPIRDFITSGLPLGNKSLAELEEKNHDPILKQGLDWSEAVNATIADIVENVPPFPYVRECLAKLKGKADMVVVSQTPTEALQREWQEHGIDSYVSLICGQELGTKAEHIQLTTDGRYDADKILMIGDAPGDLKAARANKAKFFPINPGHEEDSWKRLYQEGIDKFLAGDYSDDYESALIEEFQAHLPELPPWKR
ncbi:MAG: HAD family hydrolase [Planctomycetota bacterium]|nr:MAG: HAD family hydrolase [Planctomycetota bacterium]